MDISERALDFVEDGQTLGLGTGRAATAFVQALADRVKAGLRIRGVPTSDATEQLARQLGIELVALEEAGEIDVCIDGADEVDPQLDLIKGYGGALVREKIVAASSRKLVILVGSEKVVSVLGERGRLPVEVVPFSVSLCRRRLEELGMRSEVRQADGEALVTDNGNWILDCRVSAIEDPAAMDAAILSIPGVLGTGIFAGMADAVLVQDGDEAQVRTRGNAS